MAGGEAISENTQLIRMSNVLVPRILIVVVVPKNVNEWLEQSDRQTIVKYCAYWASIRGESPTKNEQTVTVYIPQANRLTPYELRYLMQIVASGGVP